MCTSGVPTMAKLPPADSLFLMKKHVPPCTPVGRGGSTRRFREKMGRVYMFGSAVPTMAKIPVPKRDPFSGQDDKI